MRLKISSGSELPGFLSKGWGPPKVDSFFIEAGTLIIGFRAGSEKPKFREVGIWPSAVGIVRLTPPPFPVPTQ